MKTPKTKERDGAGGCSRAASCSLKCPDRNGFWRHMPSGEIYEIYPLEPAGGHLCFWGPEHGITYSGSAETQQVWATDEWQGHIPVVFYDDVGPWEFISANDKVSYHAENAGGAHGKDTNDK